ncbi:hypothetical protein ACFVY9_22210 [Streptomyces sp. NPDC059544]|uniref:hypothetical protein n=1 Tax=Streptomyces sp. NPDC059544 TaxID=3346861 RepID=UPI003691B27A
MSSFTKRVCVALASMAVAGGAVVGAGGNAAAATARSEHAPRPTVGAEVDNHRSDGGHAYCWDRGGGHRADHDHTGDHTGYGHGHRWDRGDGHRRDQGTGFSWGGHGGDRDGGRHDNHDRQISGR